MRWLKQLDLCKYHVHASNELFVYKFNSSASKCQLITTNNQILWSGGGVYLQLKHALMVAVYCKVAKFLIEHSHKQCLGKLPQWQSQFLEIYLEEEWVHQEVYTDKSTFSPRLVYVCAMFREHASRLYTFCAYPCLFDKWIIIKSIIAKLGRINSIQVLHIIDASQWG